MCGNQCCDKLGNKFTDFVWKKWCLGRHRNFSLNKFVWRYLKEKMLDICNYRCRKSINILYIMDMGKKSWAIITFLVYIFFVICDKKFYIWQLFPSLSKIIIIDISEVIGSLRNPQRKKEKHILVFIIS